LVTKCSFKSTNHPTLYILGITSDHLFDADELARLVVVRAEVLDEVRKRSRVSGVRWSLENYKKCNRDYDTSFVNSVCQVTTLVARPSTFKLAN